MNNDINFLKETLKLAKKGLSWTNPNPMVGAIVMKNNRIIGQGFHRQIGYPHAEIEALNNITEDPKDATMYINLETCNHFGKTPPCTEAIIRHRLKKVICSTLDPNPKVSGKGLARLQKANIETVVGILETEARKLNETFFTFHEKKRPFVAVKFAASLDGKLATNAGDSKWITNEKARAYARLLRAKYQAVLVGINTVLTDNPHLGARIQGKKDPVRIIIDPKLQIPLEAIVLRDNNVIIVTTKKADKLKKQKLQYKGITVLEFDSDHIEIKTLLSALRQKEITSVLVEGGGKTMGHFVDAGIVDKVYAFQAPIIIGGKEATGIGGNGVQTIQQALRLKDITIKKLGDNLLTMGYNYGFQPS